MNEPSAQRGRAAVRRVLACAAFFFLAGCQSLYFHPAGPPPAAPVAYRLAELPFSEYWTGIVFNGEKIGFTHFKLRPAADHGQFEVLSEASFVLRFLGIEKKINLKARDVVDDDLTLVAFDYDYRIDGSELLQSGKRSGNTLQVAITSGGKPTEHTFPAPERIYPSSVIALVPVARGLQLDREYAYQVYDGQTQTVAQVTQRVTGYESSQFFSGNAFKLSTTLHGQNTTTWIDHTGRPVFELALRGVMISALEEEDRAKRYLALGALNKQEALIEFSLVRPEAPLPQARRAARMTVALEGLDRAPPPDEWQRCERRERAVICEIGPTASSDRAAPASQALPDKYLSASVTVQSRDPGVRATARKIAPAGIPNREQVERLIGWMQTNIEKTPLDVFSALDVLEKRKAECQGHAYLYTALARALGIPTRVVNGLAYSEQLEGFLFHSWAESFIDGRWLPVDPTFGQATADATHIKLLEGEALADLLPLIDWVGKLKIRVLALEHERP